MIIKFKISAKVTTIVLKKSSQFAVGSQESAVSRISTADW